MELNLRLAFLLFFAGFLLAQVSSQQQDVASYNLNKASFQLFKQAHYQNVQGDNLVVSPVSMLLLVALYSSGTTLLLQKDILSVLGATDEFTLLQQYSAVSRELTGSSSGNALTSATKILVAYGNTFTPAVQEASNTLDVEVQSVDFSRPDNVANLVNAWAAEKTHGLISHPVNEYSFDPNTVVALFNAIYFKGNWQTPFNKALTQYRDFTTSSGDKVPKPMMKSVLYAKYNKVPGVGEFLEVPYNETDFKMVVALPDQSAGNDVTPLVDYLEKNPGVLSLDFSMGQQVDLQLPKFDVRSKLDNMNNILQGMGLNRMFVQTADNFVQNGQVSVSQTFQEAYITVDEVGTEAAVISGTKIFVAPSPFGPPPTPFHADRPFVYAILYGTKVVFAGTLTQ